MCIRDSYESLYDYSWRNAVKLITSGIFTGLFWAALLLLAGLFKVLGITFFKSIIEDVYFIYPATAVAFGLGTSLYNACLLYTSGGDFLAALIAGN